MNPLDNPIWHALNSTQADLALGDEKAKRYPLGFTTLAGMVDYSSQSFSSLSRIVSKLERVGLYGLAKIETPEYWENDERTR